MPTLSYTGSTLRDFTSN